MGSKCTYALLTLSLSTGLGWQSSSSKTTSEYQSTCNVTRSGIRFQCPAGWVIRDVTPQAITIGNFPVTPDMPKERVSGPGGKATIEIQTLPATYRDLNEWIFAGKKADPTVETNLTIRNEMAGEIRVVCLTSPATSGLTFATYFFQIGRVPAALGVAYRAEDPKAEQHRAAARRMIETARTVR